jgi:threonine/homoserine/homoserine lactone efflux protein
MFRIASLLRLGIPLLYALFVSILFPDFVQEHEILATEIFLAMLGLVILSWVVTIRKKILRKREQKQYETDING